MCLLDLTVEVACERLGSEFRHPEEAFLVSHPEVLEERSQLYRQLFRDHSGPKLLLDGTRPTAELVAAVGAVLGIQP